MTVTPTAIQGSNVGGDCQGPASTSPCTGAIHFVQGAKTNFSSVDPLVLYELDSGNYSGVAVNQLNKLSIVKVDPEDPTTWTMTRVKLFNFNCEGEGCPATSATESFVGGFNIGTSTHNCLVKGYRPTWEGTVSPSFDDSSFSIAWSDNGQGGRSQPDAVPPKTGGVYITVWTSEKGCRLYNTWTGIIQGDWGDVGPIFGPDGVTPILDKTNLHEAGTLGPSKYTGISSGNTTCADLPAGTCVPSCVDSKGAPMICGNYYWENPTRIVRGCGVRCDGHQSQGYINTYKGKQYRAHNYGNPDLPLTPLFTDSIGFPGDQHGSYNNSGTSDLTPVSLSVAAVCGQAPGVQGAGPCDPAYTSPRYNEIIAVENQVTNAGNAGNSNGQHCNYGVGPTACVYRLAHCFNTGTQWQFATQNCISNISPDGHYVMFASDWNGTLGCTDGTTTCMDSITASGGGVFNGNIYTRCPSADTATQPCQRSDLFIADLLSAHSVRRRSSNP